MGKISRATITIEVVSGGPLELSDMRISVEPPVNGGDKLTAAQEVAAGMCEMAIERAKRTVELHAKYKATH